MFANSTKCSWKSKNICEFQKSSWNKNIVRNFFIFFHIFRKSSWVWKKCSPLSIVFEKREQKCCKAQAHFTGHAQHSRDGVGRAGGAGDRKCARRQLRVVRTARVVLVGPQQPPGRPIHVYCGPHLNWRRPGCGLRRGRVGHGIEDVRVPCGHNRVPCLTIPRRRHTTSLLVVHVAKMPNMGNN